MAKKKSAKTRSKPLVADSPVTVGGGGGQAKIAVPLTITFVKDDWVMTNGPGSLVTLAMATGRCFRIKVSDEEEKVVFKAPLDGSVTVELKCRKQ